MVPAQGLVLMQPHEVSALRLLFITEGLGKPEWIIRTVERAIAAGLRAVQVRERDLTAAQLRDLGQRLRPALDEVGGLLFLNDRLDVALAGHAHGVQLGHHSLPMVEARRLTGRKLVLGASAHDAAQLEEAAAGGADFALLSPVHATGSKPGAPPLGVARAADLTRSARLPVVWLGGFDHRHVSGIGEADADSRPIGVAVRGAISKARDAGAETTRILAALEAAGL